MAYENPTPVAVGIIESTTPGNLLFVERADGGIALVSGYVDKLENAAKAITRESEEEMGLYLNVPGWTLFDSATNSGNRILLFSYYNRRVKMPSNFVPNEEVVALHDLPWDTQLKFPLHMEAVKLWHMKYRKITLVSKVKLGLIKSLKKLFSKE